VSKVARTRLSRRSIERWLVESGFACRNGLDLVLTDEG
jgi:hypothetical protein